MQPRREVGRFADQRVLLDRGIADEMFARLEKPIDFDAVDSRPVDLVFLLLVPANADKERLAALASVSRRLRDPEIAHRLRAISEPRRLYAVLAGTVVSGGAAAAGI